MGDACCAPGREDGSGGTRASGPGTGPGTARSGPGSGPGTARSGPGTDPRTMVTVPAGRYRTGDESEWSYPGDGEGPVHDVELPVGGSVVLRPQIDSSVSTKPTAL